MAKADSRPDETRIPVICVDPCAVPAFNLFNPNAWKGESKAVVLSCSTEFSVLHNTAARIAEICRSPKVRCQPHFDNLRRSWGDPTKASLRKTVCYGQVPELHVLIEGFFSGIKSLLDLIVQLISTEKVVGAKLDGFHRTGEIYGGSVLNALVRNACAGKKEVAKRVKELIVEHKQRWIDEVISSRDILVHPTKGAHQLMFELRVAIQDGVLSLTDALPPMVGSMTIDRYSAARLEDSKQFAQGFLAALRGDSEGAESL